MVVGSVFKETREYVCVMYVYISICVVCVIVYVYVVLCFVELM